MTTSHTPNTTPNRRYGRFAAFGAAALTACFALAACEPASESANPPRNDVDAGWTCSVESDVVRSSGTITNHSSNTSFYVIATEFRSDGHVVDQRSTSIDGVEPGETARIDVTSSDVVDDSVTCHIASIDRFKA